METSQIIFKDPGGAASFPYSNEERILHYTVPTLAKKLGMDPSWVRRLIYKKVGLYAHKEGGIWIVLIDPLFVPLCIAHRWHPGPVN